MRRVEFSGCDGSGKTTALEGAAAYLRGRGLRVLCSREVGSPHVAACVVLRGLALAPEAGLCGEARELVCAAMRMENDAFYARVCGDYDVLLSDRGYLDHLAYGDASCGEAFTRELFAECVGRRTARAELVLLFEVEADEAARRREARGGAVDAVEAQGVAFQEAVAARFRHHAAGDRTVRVVDAGRAREEVAAQVRGALDALLGLGPA